MIEKATSYGLIALTAILGSFAAVSIGNDYQRGANSEFNLTGLPSLLMIALLLSYLLVLVGVGSALRFFNKKSLGQTVHRACLISLPLLIVMTVGALILSDTRGQHERQRRNEATETINRERQQQEQTQIAIFKKILQADPNNTPALIKRAEMGYNRFRFNEAIVDYSRVISLEPQNAEARKGLARSLVAIHKFDEAILHYQAAIEIVPAEKELLTSSIQQCRDLKQEWQKNKAGIDASSAPNVGKRLLPDRWSTTPP